MTNDPDFLAGSAALGRLSRRDFLGQSAALGVSLTSVNLLLTQSAMAQTPVRGGLLRAGMANGAAGDSLDPATWTSSVAIMFGHQWGEQLVQLSPTGEALPGLAEEWGASKDVTEWTFRIRRGVEFHNGKEMTPADVVATIERHSDKNSKSAALGILAGIKSIRVDDQNVVIGLNEPNADLPYIFSDDHLVIQPNGGKDNPAEGIGTGPYRIAANQPGIRMAGERYANYWRDDRGFADQIEAIVINDATARTAALQSGQVDMISHVEPKVVEFLKRTQGVTIRPASGKGHYLFVMRCDTALFENNDLRLALKYAIDRDEIVQKVLMGYGSVGNDTPINKAYPLFTQIEQRRYDPDKAAFHYKKSAHSGPLLLRTADVGFPGAVDAAQLFQQTAAKAGITLQIKREPSDGYWSNVWNAQPFCATNWGGRQTQDQMYATAYQSTARWNETRFIRPDVDRMLLQARGELDAAKRKAIYADVGQIVRDEGGSIIVAFNDFIDATGPRVGGWVSDGNRLMMGSYALSKCWRIA